MIEFPIERFNSGEEMVDELTPRPPDRERLEGLLEYVGKDESGDLLFKPVFAKERLDEIFKAEPN